MKRSASINSFIMKKLAAKAVRFYLIEIYLSRDRVTPFNQMICTKSGERQSVLRDVSIYCASSVALDVRLTYLQFD